MNNEPVPTPKPITPEEADACWKDVFVALKKHGMVLGWQQTIINGATVQSMIILQRAPSIIVTDPAQMPPTRNLRSI
jgi:hypothetical protein